MYSKKLLEEFFNPVNVGVIKGADAVGKIKDRGCGDIVKIYISVKNDKVADVKFQTYGSTVAIAATSVSTKLIMGKTFDEVYAVNADQLKAELGGVVPKEKLYALTLVENAIHMALNSYLKKTLGYIPEKYKVGEIANSDEVVDEAEEEEKPAKKAKAEPKKAKEPKAKKEKKQIIENSDIDEDEDFDDEEDEEEVKSEKVKEENAVAKFEPEALPATQVTKTTQKTVEVYTRDLDDADEEDKLFNSFDNITSTLSDALKKLNDEE